MRTTLLLATCVAICLAAAPAHARIGKGDKNDVAQPNGCAAGQTGFFCKKDKGGGAGTSASALPREAPMPALGSMSLVLVAAAAGAGFALRRRTAEPPCAG